MFGWQRPKPNTRDLQREERAWIFRGLLQLQNVATRHPRDHCEIVVSMPLRNLLGVALALDGEFKTGGPSTELLMTKTGFQYLGINFRASDRTATPTYDTWD